MSPACRARVHVALVALVAMFATLAFVVPHSGRASADPPPPPVDFSPAPCVPPDPCNPPPRPLPPFHFVVLGDSFTSGEGASRNSVYVPTSSGMEDWRHRSGFSPAHVAWTYLELGRRPVGSLTIRPNQLQQTWGSDRLYFKAASGAETKHLTAEEQKESLGQLRNQRQLDDVETMSQLAYFGLGGNDAGFGGLMSTALKAHYLHKYSTTVPWQTMQLQAVVLEVERLLKRMPQVTANIEKGLADTRETLPVADIIVSLYPLGVKASGNADLPEIAGASMAVMHVFAQAVNKAIRDAVRNFQARYPQAKVHIFDPNTAGPGGTSVVAGHELGQPESYFNGVKFRRGAISEGMFKAMQESFHPNELGGVAIGKALATWMAEKFPHLFPNGPNFRAVNANPQASVTDPADTAFLEEWATTHPYDGCEGADPDSVCQWISPTGITIPLPDWFNPTKLKPLPGAPAAGGDDQGRPSVPSNNGSTGIPGAYFPKDPCDIFKAPPVDVFFFSAVSVQGAPFPQPRLVHELILNPPKCVPGIGVVYW
jgi:lysophospholipase L1-like esterase